MIQGGGRQIDRRLVEAQQQQAQGGHGRGRAQRGIGQGRLDPLGTTRRPRGVEHVDALDDVGVERLGRLGRDGLLVAVVPVDGPVEHEPQLDGGGLGQDRLGQLGLRDRRQIGPSAAVVDDVGGLVGQQPRTDRGVVQPGIVRPPCHLEKPRVVLHAERDVVTGLKPGRPEQPGQAGRRLVQLTERGDLAGGRHDLRRPIGVGGGVGARIVRGHGSPDSSDHAPHRARTDAWSGRPR